MPENDDPRPAPATSNSLAIEATTIGEAWLMVSARIMETGKDGIYDDLAMREILLATLQIAKPRARDEIIDRYADETRMAWMRANFGDRGVVEALGDADSYATRLRDYARAGRDQIQWVCQRLLADPTTRSATITTFQPLTDTTYVPCVSLLDFFLIEGCLRLVVYAHSIDFGAKGFANLVEIAELQEEVARTISAPVDTMTMIVKSAHIYDTDFTYMREVLSAQPDV